ncbi:RHS repeat-associated core domain-containing protein [Kribbella sp. NPDC056861]|uniref:RHS repeat-associated core domain-containing protein n=1 Tax=Kribbella sp. NPDC056861 TaxID=3154857 RepID=UPI00342B6720
MSRPTRRHLRRILLSGTAAVTALAVLVCLHGPAAEAASAGRTPDDPAFTPRTEKSVRGTSAAVEPRRADPAEKQARTATPPVAWPRARTAEVVVPAPAVTSVEWGAVLAGQPGTPRGVMAPAAGTPIRVGPTRAANRSASVRDRQVAAATPGRVSVQILDRQAATVPFRLTRTDGVAVAGPVAIEFDYQAFANAYGGDWSSRLRLVRLPECALSTPAAAGCAAVPLPTRNDGSGLLTADAVATGKQADGGLYAVQAAAAGGAGDFKASALSPSGSWQVGGPSGDFSWSYPMELPPSTGGPAAEVSLEYSSGSVDGRTTSTNNQPSWAGEGFDLNPGGAIERRYASCGSKSEQSGSNGTKPTGDLCWATDNATFALGGKSGELIRDDQTGVWRPRVDDGTRVERITGAVNGDNDGEYWVITSADGTKSYFGLNRLAGWTSGKPETKSTWTVPVFGNHQGEPCSTGTFATSHCQQAYRWNLDYVVDRQGNTMSFFYDTEINNYGRNVTATAVSSYVRAGNLNRIEYGQRDGQALTTPAVARVVFSTAERCIPGSACTPSQPATYPDTPLDQVCSSTTSCPNKFNPTFWTQKRLAKVTTEVWRGTGFAPVDSWTLRHSFPDPGDGTRPGLWLAAISNAGHVGGAISTPEVNFTGLQLPNRVAGTDGIPVMNWWRVKAIHYGTGGELAVSYSPQDCSLPGNVPAPDTNGKRCHPTRWTPEGQAERQDWFNKYVVTEVTESDRVSGLEPVVTRVEYLTPPAWRHDEEDGLVEIGRKTWSQWRGYERVRVTKGSSAGRQSVVEHRYHRGMDGDKLAGGGQKDVRLTDSTGAVVEDVNALSGVLREQLTYDGSVMVSRSVTDQWISAPTSTRVRTWGTTQAFKVEESATRQDEAVDGGLRKSSSANSYDSTGRLTASQDANDLSTTTDDTCTRYEYAQNPATGLQELRSRQQVVSVPCAQNWTTGDVISDERIYYDNATSHTAPPTKGNPTRGERLTGFDANGVPQYQTVYTAEYDALGRQTKLTDAMNRSTSKSFTPADGGPVTQTVDTDANGHTTTTDLDPAWGEETAVRTADGRTSQIAYDPLGRTDKVWLQGRDRTQTPDMDYDYVLNGDGAGVITTRTLQTDGSIDVEKELFDGLSRSRQKQEAAAGGGRIVTDYVYDSRGNVVKENGQYYNDAPPGDDVLLPVEAELPTQKLLDYDAADRPVTERFVSEGTEKWRTSYDTTAARHTVVPPAGEQPIAKYSDVQGRLVEQRQFVAGTPTGSYDSTKYAYHKAGQLASVTDPGGNVWRFDYDLAGRKIREIDPDKGTTTYTYDSADRLLTMTDGRGQTLAYAYDEAGRKTAIHEGSLSGTKRAAWTYDTMGKGLATSSTRYVDGNAYITSISGYDAGGRPTGMQLTLPASEGALAGTYSLKNTYNADGEVATSEQPAMGGLPAETLRFGYNAKDLPTTLTGLTPYVTNTAYTPYGELETLTMAQGAGKWIQQKYEYEVGTRRLSRVVTDRETAPRRISSVTYAYDPAGNVRQITDTPSSQSGEPTDTQCFSHDHLRRLTGAWTPADGDCGAAPSAGALGGPAPYWHSWTIDKSGNRTSEVRRTAASTTTSTYEYPATGQPRPHALQKVTTTGPTGTKTDTYGYDAAGNQTARAKAGVGETFTWDAEGELQKVTRGSTTTSFLYDADGTRILRRDATGTALYFGDNELLLQPDGKLVGTRYYGHANQTIAVRTNGKLTWLGADHNGTPNLAIDADTQTFQRRRSTPYGELRGAAPTNWPGERGFVGGVTDTSTDLVHLQAREYDPSTGRFISVDPVADYEDGQQLNGYAYANNSPVTYTDPDGQIAFIPIIILAIRLVPVVVRIARAIPTVVRVTTPVVRTVATTVIRNLRSFWGWLTQAVSTVFRSVTTWITRAITVIKRTVETVRRFVPQVVRTVRRVPVKAKPAPHRGAGPRARKPASVGKHRARAQIRNTPKPHKSRVKLETNSPKSSGAGRHRWATAEQKRAGERLFHQNPKFAFRSIESGPKYQVGQLRDRLDAAMELAQPFDPWSMDAYKGPQLESPEYYPDGTKKFGNPANPNEVGVPRSRGGRFALGASLLLQLIKQVLKPPAK